MAGRTERPRLSTVSGPCPPRQTGQPTPAASTMKTGDNCASFVAATNATNVLGWLSTVGVATLLVGPPVAPPAVDHGCTAQGS
eukprot:11218959-Lingulodinium_polyedra.AAC.1